MKRHKKIKNRNLHKRIHILKRLFKNVDKVAIVKVNCSKDMTLDSVAEAFMEIIKND